MNNPLISIIIPVYNVEDYIRPCLDSILAQTYTNFEAILVDDGSKDGSGRICDEYAEKDSRFVVVHKDNEGVAKARITAFEHSKGELITFIDSDDYVSPLYLEKLAKPIIEDDADMVSCDFYYDRDGKITESTGFLTGMYEGEALKDFIANHYFYDKTVRNYGITNFLWTKIIRRGFVFDGLQNGLGLWFGEDQISMFSMLKSIAKLAVIPNQLYYYVRHQGQATTIYNFDLWRSIITMLEQYEKMDLDGSAKDGLRKRTWIYIIFTIFVKMKNASLPQKEFCEHISRMRNSEYMKKFFQPCRIGLGIKDELKYWILKLKLYIIIYHFCK